MLYIRYSLNSHRERRFLMKDLSVVRRVGVTEPRRAAWRTDRQAGRREGGGDCCNPKDSGQSVEKGGA